MSGRLARNSGVISRSSIAMMSPGKFRASCSSVHLVLPKPRRSTVFSGLDYPGVPDAELVEVNEEALPVLDLDRDAIRRHLVHRLDRALTWAKSDTSA